jgi:hypothetical protein
MAASDGIVTEVPNMYPKQIMDALLRSRPDWLTQADKYGGDVLLLEFAERIAHDCTVEDWILGTGSAEPAIAAYLDYLRCAKARFRQVKSSMGYWNTRASHSLQHDKWSVGWAGDELMPLANYLYVVKSFGAAGDCLECGAFKGSSTACLSYVCGELGMKLYCADSFAGLPSAEGHYGAGDFVGSRAEVEDNVKKCGNIESVHFIEGWYRESLRGFAEPLSVIWMDVDLQQSVIDVMENVFPNLVPGGVIFSDGVTERDMTADGRLLFTGGEPAGFCRFFQDRAVDARAMLAGPKGLVLILPRPQDTPWLRTYPHRLQYLLDRL